MIRLLPSMAALAVAALLAPATAVSSAQETRPQKATCVAVPDDPLSPTVHVTGTCQTTHLGRSRFESSHTVIPLGFPDGDGVVPVAVVGGTGSTSPPTATSSTRRTKAPAASPCFSGGTGAFRGFEAEVHVSEAAGVWHWDGTYSFSPPR